MVRVTGLSLHTQDFFWLYTVLAILVSVIVFFLIRMGSRATTKMEPAFIVSGNTVMQTSLGLSKRGAVFLLQDKSTLTLTRSDVHYYDILSYDTGGYLEVNLYLKSSYTDSVEDSPTKFPFEQCVVKISNTSAVRDGFLSWLG